MDIFSLAPQASPQEAPKKIFITINGNSVDLLNLRDAIDAAVKGGPQAFETTTGVGTAVRILVDRLGPPITGN